MRYQLQSLAAVIAGRVVPLEYIRNESDELRYKASVVGFTDEQIATLSHGYSELARAVALVSRGASVATVMSYHASNRLHILAMADAIRVDLASVKPLDEVAS